MPVATPRSLVTSLIAALRDREIDAVVALYEENATLAVYPGMTGQGRPSIRTFFEAIFKLNTEIRYNLKSLVEAGDLALFTARWSIAGTIPDDLPVPRTNHQAAILRKQPDGNWLIAVDDPWGPVPPRAPGPDNPKVV